MIAAGETTRVPFVRDEASFPLVACGTEASRAPDLLTLQRVMEHAGVRAADVYKVLCALTPFGRAELDLTSPQRNALASGLSR